MNFAAVFDASVARLPYFVEFELREQWSGCQVGDVIEKAVSNQSRMQRNRAD